MEQGHIHSKDVKSRLSGLLPAIMLCCLVLAACSGNDEDGDAGGGILQMGSCLTRAADMSLVDGTRLTFFLANGNASSRFTFSYNDESDSWTTSATTNEGTTYYIYGYMPAGNVASASISPLAGDYSNGAELTLNGLDPVSQQEVCIVTGVKGGADVRLESDITEWSYQYKGQAVGANYVNLLLGHIYAALTLNITVNEDYTKLRTIKLKEVRVQSSSAAKVNVRISQGANTAPVLNFTTTDATADIPQLMTSTAGEELSVTEPVTAGCYLLPCLTGLTLSCTYDVYDKKGVLLRENCKSENNLQRYVNMTAGARTTLNLTVNPTYLYILSDNDLNNPTINITE